MMMSTEGIGWVMAAQYSAADNMYRDYDKWSYLEQWIEDCYWEEIAALDDIIEYRDYDMPKLRKLLSNNIQFFESE